MSHWKLGRRHPACLRCQRPFGEGEAHYSVLASSADSLERLDLCHACWPAEQSSGAVGRAWWRARRPLGQRRGLAVDLEGLEALFHALAEAPEERLRELRYVLCLLLLRKRRLFLVRATMRALPGSEQRGEFLVVRRPRRKEEEFLVQVYDLAAERMESLRSDLERLFEGAGLEDLAGAAPAAPGAGPDGGKGAQDAPGLAGGVIPPGEAPGAPGLDPQAGPASPAGGEGDPAPLEARDPGAAEPAPASAAAGPAVPETAAAPGSPGGRPPVRRVARRASAAPRGLEAPGLGRDWEAPPAQNDAPRGLAAG